MSDSWPGGVNLEKSGALYYFLSTGLMMAEVFNSILSPISGHVHGFSVLDFLRHEGMARAYKYVDAGDAEYLMRGTLKIGTLRSYGALESDRADPREGRVDMHIRSIGFGKAATHPDADAIAKSMGMYFGPNVDVRFTNNTHGRRTPNYYCFCMSVVPNNLSLCREKEQAIFEVTGIRSLIAVLADLEPRLSGPASFSRVTYKPTSGDVLDMWQQQPSPFVKEPRFESEREIRIIWMPTDKREPIEFVTEPSARVAALLRRVV